VTTIVVRIDWVGWVGSVLKLYVKVIFTLAATITVALIDLAAVWDSFYESLSAQAPVSSE
jgi:hypothetical protein